MARHDIHPDIPCPAEDHPHWPEHPHVLVICSDQHAPQVSGFGGDPHVKTPHLDRLAARGTVFSNHYAANPVCCPGRLSIATGQLPRELGCPRFLDVLTPGTPTYQRHFAQNGYWTTCVGKQHFHGQDQMQGWMLRPYGDLETSSHDFITGHDRGHALRPAETRVRYQDYGGYTPFMLKTARPGRTSSFMVFDESVTRESIIHLTDYFTNEIAERYQGERPLLFHAGFKTPHCPFIAPAHLFERYRRILPPPRRAQLPPGSPRLLIDKQRADQPEQITEEMIANARAGYWALVQWTDQQVGALLDHLEAMDMLDRFIIVYTTDHGELAGEMGLWQKHTFHEESARVPMIIAGPGIPAGRTVVENTSHCDLFPTLAELAGLPLPHGIRGESMVPLLHTDSIDRRTVFSEVHENDGSSSVMAKRGSVKLSIYAGEPWLVDLATDPDESRNLMGDPVYAAIEADLRAALVQLPPVDLSDERPGMRNRRVG